MSDIDLIPRKYEDAVSVLAAAHAGDDVAIYSMPDPEEKVVRLIEVSAAFPEGGVERSTPQGGMEWIVPVFPMGPAKDFPFRSEIVQVTPEEWNQLLEGKLRLNRNWGDLKSARGVRHGH